MVIEDERSINEAYQTVLKSAGYDVQAAYNGQEALDMAAKKEPDLILLDLRMPQMDGLEFLRQYDLKKRPNVKVIIFSNYDIEDEIKDAYGLGAQRYVLKAWTSPRELENLVANTLRD